MRKNFFDRKEAALVRKIDPFNKLNPYMMQDRDMSCIYFKETFDATSLEQFVLNSNKEYTYFGVIMAAIVRTFALRPQLNRFVAGKKIYQRNKISISFTAKKAMTEEASETNIRLNFDRDADLSTVTSMLKKDISAVKNEDEKDDTVDILKTFAGLPRFMKTIIFKFCDWLDFHNHYPKVFYDVDPCQCSCFLTNLGSIGLNSVPYHHLYNRGTCSCFVAIGKIHNAPLLQEDGTYKICRCIEMSMTLDERVSNGFYYIKAIQILKDLISHPEQLCSKLQEVPKDD